MGTIETYPLDNQFVKDPAIEDIAALNYILAGLNADAMLVSRGLQLSIFWYQASPKTGAPLF
jgi:hypothetical protein